MRCSRGPWWWGRGYTHRRPTGTLGLLRLLSLLPQRHSFFLLLWLLLLPQLLLQLRLLCLFLLCLQQHEPWRSRGWQMRSRLLALWCICRCVVAGAAAAACPSAAARSALCWPSCIICVTNTHLQAWGPGLQGRGDAAGQIPVLLLRRAQLLLLWFQQLICWQLAMHLWCHTHRVCVLPVLRR